ncbi:MAG: 50S ribosomal protein L4 [Bacteroidia bacterium]
MQKLESRWWKISFDTPKTKQFAGMLNNMSLGSSKVLLVLSEPKNQYTSLRSQQKNAEVLEARTLNTFDILNADTCLLKKELWTLLMINSPK